MFWDSFILKRWNYIEGVLVNRNVNSESVILICGHYKMGMCLACLKECRNTVLLVCSSCAAFYVVSFFCSLSTLGSEKKYEGVFLDK